MKILVTGGSGFIGSRLCAELLADGHRVLVLTRFPERATRRLPPRVELLAGDLSQPGDWTARLSDVDAAVNLAGESIFGRWNPEKKMAIARSRIDATRHLVASLPERPLVLVSQSAVGYYGFHGDEPLTESDPPGADFLASIAVQWEAEALKAAARGARVVILRTGIVLGHGGALDQMVHVFRLYGGGPVGSGRQYISWIHLDDEISLIRFALSQPTLDGPLNATAPHPVTNSEFSRSLGAVLHRPSLLHAPAFAMRLVLGEFAETVLHGQRVIPRRALDAGFSFRHPELEPALRDLLGASL